MHTEQSIVKPDWFKGQFNDYVVLTMEALLKVLRDRAFEAKLAAYPDAQFAIFFRNWSADIGPNDELWKMIAGIAEDYAVEVWPNGAYCPTQAAAWTGRTNRFGRFAFKHVTIRNRVAVQAAA